MQEFTNDPIDINLLPQYQDLPLRKLSSRYWIVALINISIFLAVLGIGLVTFFVLKPAIHSWLYAIGIAYLLLAILILIWYRMDINRRGFAIREKDIIYRHGFIAISTTIIPFSRVQHIALDEGLFLRMFQLGTLGIFTAGGSSGSLHIPGIEIETARQIKNLLMEQINVQD